MSNRCLNFTVTEKFAWNLGAPSLGGPLDFAHPAHPIATPLCPTRTDSYITQYHRHNMWTHFSEARHTCDSLRFMSLNTDKQQ